MGVLADLRDAAEALEDLPSVVRSAARAMAEACPRGIGVAVALSGWPATSIAAIAAYQDGEVPSVYLDAYRRLYPRLPLVYDRYRVARPQRNVIRELFADEGMSPDELRRIPVYDALFRPLGALGQARAVVCIGSRPVGVLGQLLPELAPALLDGERRRLQATVDRLIGPFRIATRLQEAESAHAALDHLMASRADAAVVATPDGRVLSASAAARRLLDERSELVAAVRSVVRQGAPALLGDLELHLTPCAPRGRAPAWLVLIGRAAPPVRGRWTDRQAEVLALVREGLTNAEIADRMAVSPTTVKTWLQRLYRRTGTRNRVELLRWAP